MRKWVTIGVLALMIMSAGAASASAQDCFADLRRCYYAAAREATWGDLWIKGLDCELDFVDCVRRKIVGR